MSGTIAGYDDDMMMMIPPLFYLFFPSLQSDPLESRKADWGALYCKLRLRAQVLTVAKIMLFVHFKKKLLLIGVVLVGNKLRYAGGKHSHSP